MRVRFWELNTPTPPLEEHFVPIKELVLGLGEG